MPMLLGKFVAPLLLALALSADPFSYTYSSNQDGSVYFEITANDPLNGVEATIIGDGKTIKKTLPNLKPGQKHRITWKQSAKTARYELELAGGGVTAAGAFEIQKTAAPTKVGKLQPVTTRDDILERHEATFKTPFALTAYEYKVYDGEGYAVAKDTVTENVPAGGKFTVKWHTSAPIFMVWVRGEGETGAFAEYKLVPWAVEIPHTEINFDTGKWDIKKDQAPKLDEAVAVAFHELVALEKVNEAVGAAITPQLYIVGYTDTVGSAASNQKLSNERARAIAGYFRDKGFWAEIHYAGMGEQGLRVQTDDNVDEVRNRRALYLIGVQKPAAGGQIPARWSRLVGARPKPAGFELPPLPEKWKDYRENRQHGAAGEGGDAGMEDTLPGGGAGSGDGGEQANDSSGLEGLDYGDGGDDGPPPVEGEPGAAKKGCSVAAPTPMLGLWVLAAIGLGRRRRRS